ncbi:MAG TPA: hypothetical protein VFV15_06330, partial [Moraxellaceae bacterium]|nr:hypothetical protein [Moraxellaceae bacterium]
FTRAVQVLPRWLDANVRKWVKDDRILTGLDRGARAAYEQRLAALRAGQDATGAAPADAPQAGAAAAPRKRRKPA